MQEQYYLYTERLSVGYDGKPLIRDIEIKLKRGQILTLIGPNGAGKSTILKSITRQLRLVAGTVYLDKNLLHTLSSKEISQKLAVVLTDRIRPEMMTCEEMVATGRYPYTGALGILSPEDWKKVHEAMELVHALDLKDRDFLAISDGQRQRILLARAICQEPEIIVLDEPTSFLDIRHKLELLTILKNMVKKKNLAVMMSLHEIDLAQKVSDLVVCVHGETIEKYGPPEEIFTTDYIRTLYGMTNGIYNADYGCLELNPPEGKPETFVIGGMGTGIPMYRKLQRDGIPFIAGILPRNDMDYPIASALAAEVIEEQPYEPVQDSTLEAAQNALSRCRKLICCLPAFGSQNRKLEQLLTYAKDRQIEIQWTGREEEV